MYLHRTRLLEIFKVAAPACANVSMHLCLYVCDEVTQIMYSSAMVNPCCAHRSKGHVVSANSSKLKKETRNCYVL